MGNLDREVLTDLMELARQEPAAVHVWHRLFQAATSAPSGEVSSILERVRAQVPPMGLGGFLAATFAHALCGDVEDLATASRIFTGSHLPSDAGLALLNTIYAAALASTPSVPEFAALVRGSGFLDVAGFLGRRLMRPDGSAIREAPAGRRPRPQKIAVVAPTLSSGFHAPTDMVLRHACLLTDSGLETTIFAAQEFLMLDMASWLGAPRSMRINPAQPEGWPRAKRKLTVRLAAGKLSMQARWRILLEQIAQFDPDVVLFIGPFSPMLPALHQQYPLVGLGTHALAPVGPLDVWLAPHSNPDATWAPHFRVGKSVLYSHRFSLQAASDARGRDSLGIPDKALVWVTVGSRLAREITPGWRDRVLAVLDRHPNCHWLLVGLNQEQLDSPAIEHPRVHLRGFDRDLPSLLKACDLFLNPPRMGGGHSLACAMAQGVAVLALAGGDGGDKLGPWAQPDETSYFRALDELADQPPALRQMGERLRQRYLDTFDLGQGASGLLAALKSAVDERRARGFA